MGYEASIQKAWEALNGIGKDKAFVKFLSDEYEIDFINKKIFSMSCNIEPKDYYKILILHYLANEKNVSGIEADNWISFRELPGGDAYFPAFRKRSIEPILRKYGQLPTEILDRAKTLDAEITDKGTASISIGAFPKIKVGVVLWSKDEEFEADCNMIFNSSIKEIFPTEDVVVLGGIIASVL